MKLAMVLLAFALFGSSTKLTNYNMKRQPVNKRDDWKGYFTLLEPYQITEQAPQAKRNYYKYAYDTKNHNMLQEAFDVEHHLADSHDDYELKKQFVKQMYNMYR